MVPLLLACGNKDRQAEPTFNDERPVIERMESDTVVVPVMEETPTGGEQSSASAGYSLSLKMSPKVSLKMHLTIGLWNKFVRIVTLRQKSWGVLAVGTQKPSNDAFPNSPQIKYVGSGYSGHWEIEEP